jgi:hypothetical protein
MKTWLEREKREREKNDETLNITFMPASSDMEFVVDEIHLDFMKCHLTKSQNGPYNFDVALIAMDNSNNITWVKARRADQLLT